MPDAALPITGIDPHKATHAAAVDVPLERIADLLGHTDTLTLEHVYRHP